MRPLLRALLFSFALTLALGVLAADHAHAANLVYADEFNGPLDTTTWRQLTPWYTHRTTGELQYYAEGNLSYANGTMRLLTERRAVNGYNYASAIITSLNRPQFSYGYFETRAKLPTGKGLWPAFWLTNDRSLEIDIMELLGEQPTRMYMTYHRAGTQVYQRFYDGPDFSAGYHTFAVDWQPTYIRWYVDDVLRAEYKGSVPSDPMWLIFNTSVGGAWPQDPDASTPLPQTYEVDYLRVYDQKPAPIAPPQPTQPAPTEPAPTAPPQPTQPAPTAPPQPRITVYRFYNAKSGTHFYTSSAQERDMVIASWPGVYKYEGIAYTLNPATNSSPLYRFYNPRLGAHFYTASSAERDQVIAALAKTYTYEGIGYNVARTPDAGPAVFRFYNKRNGAHFYTASVEERDAVAANYSKTYTYEGPMFYLGQ